MTLSRRDRLHFLALPVEVRSLIIKELCRSAMCFLRMARAPKYAGVWLSLLKTCHALRRETFPVLARSMRFVVWNSKICMPCVHRSLLPGLWDHLREITYFKTAPALDQLEYLKRIESLEYVHWKLTKSRPWDCYATEDLRVPIDIDHQGWNVGLERWVVIVPEEMCLPGPGIDHRAWSGAYTYLDVPFKVQVHFHMHADVKHPITAQPGYLDLVSHRAYL